MDYPPRADSRPAAGSLPVGDSAPSATPRWRAAVVLVAAITMALLTARLGLWQLDRAAQKQALQAALEQRALAPVLPPEALAGTPSEALDQHYRRTRLRGEWLAASTVFLDNRQMHGRPGFFVLTPLRVSAAPGQGGAPRIVWVQRGWVPRDNEVRTRVPQPRTPQGEVRVDGHVAPAPARLYQFAADAAGPIRQNLDIAATATELGPGVLPMTVVQTVAPDDGADGLLRDWPRPAVDVSKHHGYAFQWFALSALVTGLYVWFQLLRPRRRRAG